VALFALLTVLLMLLSAWTFVWWQRADALPPQTARTATLALPRPNAYDFYVRAGRQAVDGPFLRTPAEQRKELKRLVTRAETAVGLRRNAKALKTLRAGFAYPYHEPPGRSFFDPYKDLFSFFVLAQVLSVEAQARAARSDHAGAMSSCLDALRLTEDVPHGGGIISRLVGVVCGMIGRERAWRQVDRLSAIEARAAARRLEAFTARRVPFVDSLQEEKRMAEAYLLEMFEQHSIGQLAYEFTVPHLMEAFVQNNVAPIGSELAIPGGATTAVLPLEALRVGTRILDKGKRGILADYVAYADKTIANARQPWAANLPGPPPPNDAIGALVVMGGTRRTRLRATEHEMHNALLLVALALRAHRAERGRYPADLGELVAAGYLSRLPDDPFALSGTLRYRRLAGGDKYLLYSVGADGKDDGGKPVTNKPDANGRQRCLLEEGMRGDFVLGVNTY
jgi:hypothetical protein